MEKQLNRRDFIKIVAVAGTAATCWQIGLFGTGRSLAAARRSVPIMGTIMNLTVYGPDRDACEEALTTTISTMRGLETRLSRHMEDSELARLNREGLLLDAGQDLLTVLKTADSLSRRTDGAFDVTVLPILRMHETGAISYRQQELADNFSARPGMGYENININGNRIRLTDPGMAISLDGIGKGYIVDQGVAELRRAGFNNVMVEAGGDLMVSGRKDHQQPWRIAIRNPRPQMVNKPVTIEISDRAVATSGDYMQAFTPDLRNHHILDPHSGFSPQELASCTVTAPNATIADGLATAVMVLGRKKGIELIEQMVDCEAYMVTKDLTEHTTTGFFS